MWDTGFKLDIRNFPVFKIDIWETYQPDIGSPHAQSDSQQEAEFINVFYGEDVSEEQAGEALAIFQRECPNAEITLLAGGQPVYYYMISAE